MRNYHFYTLINMNRYPYFGYYSHISDEHFIRSKSVNFSLSAVHASEQLVLVKSSVNLSL